MVNMTQLVHRLHIVDFAAVMAMMLYHMSDSLLMATRTFVIRDHMMVICLQVE